ncbi:flagellar biosynthesis protein FlhF [Candidatus Enterovibrio escicola]|uniref:flagellar biosynthesis protein FlhF n=1 Tax=Candidatus Enterovibrio escicola TaxID=1927127 RepID=UPI001237EC5B|nr:flagellar biosynthesis protein FlhF [Candidatus Enterovibrio escacola]
MKIKRFFAKNMRTALAEVKEALGADAVIMSNKKVTGGVEIVAAIDTETPTHYVDNKVVRSQMSSGRDRLQQKSQLADDKISIRRYVDQETTKKPLVSALGNKFSSLLDCYQSNLPESQSIDDTGNVVRRSQSESSYKAQLSVEGQNGNSSNDVSQDALMQHSSADNRGVRKYDFSHRYGSSQNHATSQRNNVNSHSQQQAKSQDLDRLYCQKRVEVNRREMRVESCNSSPRQISEMEAVRTEMLTIRNLLEHQLAGLMWQEVERKEPLRAMLIKRLERMGLSPVLADQLAGYIPEETSPSEAWSELLNLLADQVITSNENLSEMLGVVALLGPTGVGKTTTIAKLAARAAMDFGSEEIALVTTDTFRIGAHEQLATYGRILGCSVKIAKDADALADILYQLRHRRLILLDTAGMGQRDLRLSEQLDTLIQSKDSHIRSLLVLPATSQRRVLQETIDHFRRIPLSGCVLTKLDESLSLGELLSVTIENALPVMYLAEGQRVPEDIRQASGRYLVNKASELMDQDSEQQNHYWSHDIPEPNVADFYD